MHGSVAIVVVIVVVLILLYFFLSRSGSVSSKCGTSGPSGGCGCGDATPGSPPGTGGSCFTGIDFRVKSGLFDLRGCNDDVYVMINDRSKVHFITEQV